MHECRECKEVKSSSEFYYNRGRSRELDCKKCRNRKDSKKKSGTAAHKKNVKRYQLKAWYGLTLEEYEQMLGEQDSACAICNQYMKPVYVDHSHKTGKVRGLLCMTCNSGLGMFKDNPELLEKAIEYLYFHKEG